MEARIARLEAHTEHIQSDVQILRQDMNGLRQETKDLHEKLDTKIETKFSELDKKTDLKFGELSEKFDQLRKSLESMKIGRVWDRVWMLLAMGTLLGVMARGFKWV